MSISTGLEVLT